MRHPFATLLAALELLTVGLPPHSDMLLFPAASPHSLASHDCGDREIHRDISTPRNCVLCALGRGPALNDSPRFSPPISLLCNVSTVYVSAMFDRRSPLVAEKRGPPSPSYF